MKKIVVSFVLLFSSFIQANPIDDKCSNLTIWGAPQINVEGDNQYICKSGYAMNVNYKTKVSYFVVEHITPESLANKTASRKDDFREDPDVPVQYRVTLKDYTGTGLDRGHMAPAADFGYDAKNMSESFYMSNMMPQNQGNNRGIWKSTEELTRSWASKTELFVITGTIYQEGYKTIGNGVGVPSFIYKIVIQPANKRMIAFLYPNEKLNPKEIEKYVVSIAEIESKANIDISPKIPADLKALEEVPSKYEDWVK
jgi:endonuclease G